MGSVRLEVEDGVGSLVIDNPPLNLLSNAIRAQLLEGLDSLGASEGVRAVVISGGGDRAFSAGSDVREFLGEIDEKAGAVRARRELEFLMRIMSFRRPTVAAIEGYALGGGCELAMACDFRVASAESRLGFPEIKLGVFPINSIERSLRLLGERWTKELMLLGEPIGAEDAARAGLLNRVVPRGEALRAAKDLARRLAELPAVTVAEVKALINHRHARLVEEQGRLAADAMDRIFRTEDVREGVTAFIEKRKPRFGHR